MSLISLISDLIYWHTKYTVFNLTKWWQICALLIAFPALVMRRRTENNNIDWHPFLYSWVPVWWSAKKTRGEQNFIKIQLLVIWCKISLHILGILVSKIIAHYITQVGRRKHVWKATIWVVKFQYRSPTVCTESNHGRGRYLLCQCMSEHKN